MKATLEFTPDDLARLVAGVLEYNGHAGPVLFGIYKGTELVGYDRVVVTYDEPDLRVRTMPEKSLGSARESLMQALYGIRSAQEEVAAAEPAPAPASPPPVQPS
jgi:hypothetical protein